ncbi:MAG: sulfopyruvate decarboxylase subunit beta [Methanoregulaceae archaeon]
MHEDTVIGILKENGIDCALTLPCDKARDLFFLLPEKFPHIGLSREEDGVGVSAGEYLAGKRPAMVIQSSGLGNMLNALLSLHRTYDLPLPIIASWRGGDTEKIPAQIPFNRALPKILDAAGIPCTIIGSGDELGKIGTVIRKSFDEKIPCVALIAPPCLEDPDPSCSPVCGTRRDSRPAVHLVYERPARNPAMTRYEAIRSLMTHLPDETAVVANIGVPGRELYAVRDRNLNFYMLGSYTQASPIGFGIAHAAPKRDVVVLDGDGSLLGTAILPVIASTRPANLTIICLDNGTFGSTGNQPNTAAVSADLELLAIAAGFTNTCRVQTPEEIRAALETPGSGPRFIHVVIRPGNSDVKNIPCNPAFIRDRFMQALQRN